MTPMWGIAYSSQDDMPRIKIVYSMWEDEAEAFFHTVLFLSFLFAHIIALLSLLRRSLARSFSYLPLPPPPPLRMSEKKKKKIVITNIASASSAQLGFAN